MNISKNLSTASGWEIIEPEFIADHLLARGSIFLTGNGYLGYRGTFPEWGKDRYVGCIVSDTYDNADGNWTELCNVPNGLYTLLIADGEQVSTCGANSASGPPFYRRMLDLRHGILDRECCWRGEKGGQLHIKTQQFASFDDLHLIPFRYQIRADNACRLEIYTGIDGSVWDLNGKHLHNYRLAAEEDMLSVAAKTREQGILITVMEGCRIKGKQPLERELIKKEEMVLRRLVFDLQAGDTVVLEKAMVVYSSNDLPRSAAAAKKSLAAALGKGYDQLKKEHTPHWDRIWDKIDITIGGDLLSQVVLRFNLYHNIVATPFHSDRLPIGARGLSCQAYQGAAFWDQEIFNLPLYFYTLPEVARSILTYRYRTLDGARRKAEKLGFRGAFYAWVSGKTGDELCPSFFFTDVLTGRKIRNHFNDWQIHISPDIVYALWSYYRATGDWQFIEDCGAEIMFEVARFLYSFACYKKDKNCYEIIRVLGPDEYHENVDNNAFTNYQVRFSLDRALAVYDRLKADNPHRWLQLVDRLGLSECEYNHWREMAELLYLPQPDQASGIIEQFDGYYELEDIFPVDLEKRLIDKSEYWGWPNGVAVHTRVAKQADVLQLMVMHDHFPEDITRLNYDFYEPRCQHGSSLSPAVHSLAAVKSGYVRQAYQYFLQSCLIDLLDTNKSYSGGTFIGGIHTAACGAAWQMVVFGFAGMQISKRGLSFKPRLPEEWQELAFPLIFRQQELKITLNEQALTVTSRSGNSRAVTICAFDRSAELQPGQTVRLSVQP